MSAAVNSGAVRVGTDRTIDGTNIISSCFINPDGTYGAVLMNNGDEDKTLNIGDGTSYVRVTVPGKAVTSVKWNK